MVGDLTLDYEALAVTGDSDQTLGIYTAEPGTPSEQALRLLASWASEPATPHRPPTVGTKLKRSQSTHRAHGPPDRCRPPDRPVGNRRDACSGMTEWRNGGMAV
ncbi:hypothetical protein [Streptomyces sp. NPDC005407]|uniref:MmyB family transcriptional regulator n=1 Tax=Streptomyces sp. NPDC005407 TaxID=3155340 RepID=UPI0033AF807A